VTDLERARRFMDDILRQPDCCDKDLVVLAERFEKAVFLLMNINDLFYDYPMPNETLPEEVHEFFGLPVQRQQGATDERPGAVRAIESAILRRLRGNRIDGYTLEMAEEIAAIYRSHDASH
jgi:hypothetical protein